mmetsp:Transcript_11781/g.31945  ORF Transcript_11781/g.31945 Transcript_11781/m.31945 type:complete len:209 (-) Transcript_11781:247-873(-)
MGAGLEACAQDLVEYELDCERRVERPCDGQPWPAARGVPRVLVVRSPNGQSSCEGAYSLAVEDVGMPQGMPVWANGKGRWLYSSPVGTWSIGGSQAQASRFISYSAHLFSQASHMGAMPDQVPRTWWRAEGQEFKEDLDVAVTAMDLTVLAGCLIKDCNAEEDAVLPAVAGPSPAAARPLRPSPRQSREPRASAAEPRDLAGPGEPKD